MKTFSKVFQLPYLPITLAPLVLFSPIYLTGKALFWGTPLLQFIPWWSLAWESLLSGHPPLWNSLLGMGAPLLANYQSGLFYPPNWFYLLLYIFGGVPVMAWGQAFVVALHLAWAGVGMALLLRRLGLGVLAQSLGGLSFSLSGYLVARAGFLSINSAVAWLPWIMLGTTNIHIQNFRGIGLFHPLISQPAVQYNASPSLSAPKKWLIMLIACLTMQLLAGHAQTSWYTLVLGALWVAYWGNRAVDSRYANKTNEIVAEKNKPQATRIKVISKNLLIFSSIVVLAAGLAAAQLIPTAEYLLESQRASAVDYEFAMTYSFWPWRILSLLAPDLYGNPAQGDYWGYAAYWEDALYIGLLPFLLALTVLFSRRLNPAQHSLRNFLAIVVLVGFGLALGKNTPIFPFLYRYVPTFNLFQAPARYLIWVVFALAILAGIGADRWRRPEKRALYWTRLSTAGAFSVAIGAGLAWYFMGDIRPTFIRATALAGLWGVLAGILSLLAPKSASSHSAATSLPDAGHKDVEGSPPKNIVWIWMVLVCVALDLIVAGWGINPAGDLDLYRSDPTNEGVKKLVRDHRLFLPHEDERELKFERFFRLDTFDPGIPWQDVRATFLPDTNILDGISSANNFDPLLPARYARWMEFASDHYSDEGVLNLMDVGVLELLDEETPSNVRFELVEGSERFRWLPCAILVQEEEQAWKMTTGGQVNLDQVVILENQNGFRGPECDSGASVGEQASHSFTIALVTEDYETYQVSVNAPTSGWLLISDTWYPGWRAWVDGQPVHIYKADYIFRAIYLPGGEHQVLLAYRPVSFYTGLVISILVGLLITGSWFCVHFVPDQRKRYSSVD